MATMRTIPKAAEELKKKDPGTPISVGVLRRRVKAGKVQVVTVGKFPLINMEALEAMLEGRAYEDR